MASYYVTKVRKEWSANRSHEHIIGVITDAGGYYSNQEVTNSMMARNDWWTKVPGVRNARIKPLEHCPAPACLHRPYITTAPDHTTQNNLENLPRG